jgi:nitroreductase
MMDVIEAVKGRRSIRVFKETPISPDIFHILEESLLWAPSAGNLQSRNFYFVLNKEVKKGLMNAAYEQEFILQAPLVVVCCADQRIQMHYGERGKSLYSLQDVASSVQNLMLVAYSLGLGTTWVGAFKEGNVSDLLGLPTYLRPLALVPVGYPGEDPSAPSRVNRKQAIQYVT